ncbi:MAG: endonuclease MutS2 [Clostridium sp.]|nr:endonuclease MutS2 [Clostridium sp.]
MNQRTFKVLEFDKIINMLLGFTSSSLGRELASGLLPQTDFNKVLQSLDETCDGVSFIVKRGGPPMGGVTDIRESIKRSDKGAVLNPGELLRIAGVLRAVRNLKNYSDNTGIKADNKNIVAELIACLRGNKGLEDKIFRAIISEEEISDSASTLLANIRRQVRNSQDTIKEKLNDVLKSPKYKKYIQEPIVTMRGDRYVVPIKQEYRAEIPGLIHDSSASGATIFVEPMAVVEANNKIRELKIKEQLEIERILGELSCGVGEIAQTLDSNMSLLARIDFIFAKSNLSLKLKCTRPELNDEHKILIKKGRHPLLDPTNVVPIDFWIGQDFNTLVVTGPNTGGKTVTLKTVGLFALMAQSGLHIPAGHGTQMGVFGKIYADIGDEQSIEQSLSTFSSHMKNIVDILNKVDSNSLVLFDELGSGTDPTEGAALAMAILEYLKKIGGITVATTHYSQLKVYAVTTSSVENACCEFNVETLKPTYRLLIGVPGKSNAFAISKRLGLLDDIIGRAKEYLTTEEIKFEDMLLSIEKNLALADEERTKAKIYRLEAEKFKKEIEEQKRILAQSRKKHIREAREEARRVLLEAENKAKEIIAEMRRLQREASFEKYNEAQKIRQELKTSVDSIEEKLIEPLITKNIQTATPPQNLKPGDSVLILDLNKNGTIINPPDTDGEALIQVGIMKINIHASKLKLLDEQRLEHEKVGLGKIATAKSKNISLQVDVRGHCLEEALESVDKYIDDVVIAGLNTVSIIHGKGTGVLRNGIQKYLKTNPNVKSFRLGEYGEGGTGVTIIELG